MTTKKNQKRPGGVLYYKPGQWPDGVWRNPYGELETPKDIEDSESLARFNSLVGTYYDFVRRGEREAEKQITLIEQARSVLNLSSMHLSKEKIDKTYRKMQKYVYPDRNQYTGIEKFVRACNVITQRLQEAKDILSRLA